MPATQSPSPTATAIYAADTCTIEFSPMVRGFNDSIRAGMEKAARNAMRRDWMIDNMQTRAHADLVVDDEVKFEYHIGLQTMRYTARCTGENNLVTILSQYET